MPKKQTPNAPPQVGLSIASVLEDWGLDDITHPLSMLTSRLLSGGARQAGTSGLFHLKAAYVLLTSLKSDGAKSSFRWGKAPFTLEALGVALVFSLSPLLAAALVELRLAAQSMTRESAQGHLEVAATRIGAEIADREVSPWGRAPEESSAEGIRPPAFAGAGSTAPEEVVG